MKKATKKIIKKMMDSKFNRLFVVAGAAILVVCAFCIGNIIARGSSSGEQRIIDAIFTAMSKDNISAKIATKQSGGTSPISLNGDISMANADKISAKFTVNMQQGNNKVDASFDVRGSISNKSNLYVKAAGLGSLSSYLLSGAPEAKLYADQAVAKINGKWIVINRVGDKTFQGQNCIADVFGKLKRDKNIQNTFLDVYKNNRFIFIKNTSKDGNDTIYSVKFDREVLNKFMNSLQESSIIKDTKSCSGINLASESENQNNQQEQTSQNNNSNTNISLDIVIDDKDQLKSVNMTSTLEGGQSANIGINLSYDKVKVEDAPADDAVPVSDILSDISQMIGVFKKTAEQYNSQITQ